MKSKLSSLAPLLALILLGLAGSAFKYGQKYEASAKAVAIEVESARADMEVSESALAALLELAPPNTIEGDAPKLEQKDVALASGVGSAMALAVAHGVKIASVVSLTDQAVANAKPVSSLFAPVAMSGGRLFKADILIKGGYKDYDGFRRFFSGLSQRGVSVQSVSVKKTSFEATLRLYGV